MLETPLRVFHIPMRFSFFFFFISMPPLVQNSPEELSCQAIDASFADCKSEYNAQFPGRAPVRYRPALSRHVHTLGCAKIVR